jgi:hypothetical protein
VLSYKENDKIYKDNEVTVAALDEVTVAALDARVILDSWVVSRLDFAISLVRACEIGGQ